MPTAAEELLEAIPVWRRLSRDDRGLLAGISRVATYERGDALFAEGSPSDFFITIASGRVKVVKSTPAGKDVILEVFGPGDPIGSVAALEGRPFPASAIALERTTCLLVPRREFFGLLEKQPSLVRGLLLGLTVRLIELTNRIVELSGGRLEPRLARLFLKMAEESGQPSPAGTVIPVVLSRQDLADLAGTTIETCIRIMSRWGKEGLVITERDGFVIRDKAGLEALANL
jgi:CRP/FNR family transcriptional regulator